MKNIVFVLLVFTSTLIDAQITTSPELPIASQAVTLTFDSSKESRLGYFTGDLYAHTGVKIEGETDWQHVIESWGNNTTQPKLTNKGNGIYELKITPDINTFYGVPSNEKVIQLAFVFRSTDAKSQTNDLFVNVFEDGLVVQITSPPVNTILEKGTEFTFSARSSIDATLQLSINQNVLTQNNGKEISLKHTFNQSGNFWLIAQASANNETVYDSTQIFVRENVITESKPAGYKKGINYLSDNSVALVLWAPLKNHVFVVGDFNNWQLSNTYQMKKDGDFFWLEITDLEKGKEYIFQYLIDGEIKIADPYTEKTVDPWNDAEILETTYPNLIEYPENKTTGIASVLQTGQEEFNWQIADFQIPENEKLVIYELLVRDFTTEKTYKAVREKLDYLDDLNINVLELMPINEFEGNSSWGYNPSFYFAPDKFYGPKNELKKLIDECHQRGIAVVIDMVLNHSYGQSPFVQMYMDNWNITSENPWYNVQHNFQNTAAQWGFDFNHESLATQELVDSVASFWMSEYKVDGFRFDFTKGFSNTIYGPASWGSDYDASRISILKRMTNEIWKRKPEALVIFEHLADNSEETELANHGILLWGNMHGAYLEAARGNTGSSNLSGAVYSGRGWNKANLVSYPESHDEERIMYDIKRTGLYTPTYNIKNQQTALDRIELNSLFHILLPGPKMIWQFEERGYDVSINAFGGRTDPKPPYWQYLDNENRTDLFKVFAKLNQIKQNETVFTEGTFDYNLNSTVKWYKYSHPENKVLALGNFDIQQQSTTIEFQETGKFYEFFSGDSISIFQTTQNITLAPGEYRLYSTKKMEQVRVATNNKNTTLHALKTVQIYPNPATSTLHFKTDKILGEIQLLSIDGKKIYQSNPIINSTTTLNVSNFQRGIYIVKVVQGDNIFTSKILLR